MLVAVALLCCVCSVAVALCFAVVMFRLPGRAGPVFAATKAADRRLNPPAAHGVWVSDFGVKGTTQQRRDAILQTHKSADSTGNVSWKAVNPAMPGRMYLVPNDATRDELAWFLSVESFLSLLNKWMCEKYPSDPRCKYLSALWADKDTCRITLNSNKATTVCMTYFIASDPALPMTVFARVGPVQDQYPNFCSWGTVVHENGHVAQGPIVGNKAGHGYTWLQAFFFVAKAAQDAGMFDCVGYKRLAPNGIWFASGQVKAQDGLVWNGSFTKGDVNSWLPCTQAEVDDLATQAKANGP